MNIHELNKNAWDHAVAEGSNPYNPAIAEGSDPNKQVVSSEKIAAAKQGNLSLYISDIKAVPKEWFPSLKGLKVLCLASGGGQQAPIFAALGADVTLLDASPRQLAQDQFVAERENLTIKLIEGDMADLSAFEDESFDLIFNPISNLFVPDLEPVWRECCRVLQVGGVLITGFLIPDEFVFDDVALDNQGAFVVKYPLPYIEYETLNQKELERRIRNKEMFHFSHTMEAQLGGLTKAGFAITGFYEDRRSEEDGNPIRHYMPSYHVVRCQKMGAIV